MNYSKEKKASVNLQLFAEDVARLQFPPSRAEWVAQHTDAEAQCVDLVRNSSMAQVLPILRHIIQLLPRLGGRVLCLSIMKFAQRVQPNEDFILLTREEVTMLAEQETALEYAYYSQFHRGTRFRHTVSFFLLSFPESTTAPQPLSHADCFYASRYANQDFMLTTDMNELDTYLAACVKKGLTLPMLRIDYFSAGSFICWHLWPDTLSHLSALRAGLELHVHPAMLVDRDSDICPLSRYILRSKVWRQRLKPEQ